MTNQPIADEFPLADEHIPQRMLATAYNDLRARAIGMERALSRVANLNPYCAEIGAGMLATIITEARQSLTPSPTEQP